MIEIIWGRGAYDVKHHRFATPQSVPNREKIGTFVADQATAMLRIPVRVVGMSIARKIREIFAHIRWPGMAGAPDPDAGLGLGTRRSGNARISDKHKKIIVVK